MFKKMWIEALRNKMVVTVIVHYIWLKRELVGKRRFDFALLKWAYTYCSKW